MEAPAVALPDRRLPEWRVETFLDFYAFHLRHRAHPGGVYYLIPELRKRGGWDEEELLWYCVLNGNTQNPVTSWLLHQQGPRPRYLPRLLSFWRENRSRLQWDTDRRYHRTQLDRALEGYLALVQADSIRTGGSGLQNPFWDARRGSWQATWAAASAIPTFGRLSAWSYAEYLYIAGYGADAEYLMVGEPGSQSHRNGLRLLDGRDWQTTPYIKDRGRVRPEEAEHLEDIGQFLLDFASALSPAEDRLEHPSRLTLESALCTYKSWHKPNRRYPNVYNDMMYERIRLAEAQWPEVDFSIFWEIRKEVLPEALRLEDNPSDPGLHPLKQNHYRETGEPVVMYAGSLRESSFDRAVREASMGTFR